MTPIALRRLLYGGSRQLSRRLINRSRALTSGLWHNMINCYVILQTQAGGIRSGSSSSSSTSSASTSSTSSTSSASSSSGSQRMSRQALALAMATTSTVLPYYKRHIQSSSNISHLGRPVHLVYVIHRRYSTCEKTSTQILSKLFPQTSMELDDEESRERRKREEEEELKEMERAWQRMKIGFGAFGIGGLLFSIWAVYFFGKPALDENGNEIEDEFTALPFVQQYLARTFKSLNHFQRFIQEPSSQKLLPDPLQAPYIQPPYTLVLEVKDLLIHPDWTYQTGWRFKKRPGVDVFLRECSKYFEIVVYTAEQGITVFPLLDALDPSGYIMYRLVRDSTHFVDGHHVKNLDNLNRDLKRVVVVDWDKNSTKLHPGNTFSIARWSGNDDDTTLFDLISFLSVLGSSEVDDVREVLQYYSQFEEPIAKFRENQRKLSEQMQADEMEKKNKQKPIVKNWSRGFMKH